jgi:phosphoglycerate dehydrogenase-like enzyme
MKIVHLTTLGSLDSKYTDKLNKFGKYVSFSKVNMSADEAIKTLKNADIALIAPSAIKNFNKKIIESCPNLKHLALVTSGYNWVDTEFAKEKGISISRPIGANALAVAEHSFGMMLNLAKKITEFEIAAKNGEYDFRKFTGIEMTNKTLGIIGLGNVGKNILRISKGFGMEVLAFDRSEKSCDDFRIVTLEELLEKSDFIMVSIPLSKDTKDLISTKELKLIGKDSILVNIAREEIVNQKAIIEAIKNNKIRGYGVETEIMQSVPKDSLYFDYPNIIVNPHNAHNTIETKKRTNDMVIENIISFIKNEPKNIL